MLGSSLENYQGTHRTGEEGSVSGIYTIPGLSHERKIAGANREGNRRWDGNKYTKIIKTFHVLSRCDPQLLYVDGLSGVGASSCHMANGTMTQQDHTEHLVHDTRQ